MGRNKWEGSRKSDVKNKNINKKRMEGGQERVKKIWGEISA